MTAHQGREGILIMVRRKPGQKLSIEYFGQLLPATVAAEPLFDPAGARLRACETYLL